MHGLWVPTPTIKYQKKEIGAVPGPRWLLVQSPLAPCYILLRAKGELSGKDRGGGGGSGGAFQVSGWVPITSIPVTSH